MKKLEKKMEMKKSKYWNWHRVNAPLTREELNNSELKIVQYHTEWDDENQKYVRYWHTDDVSMKAYIGKNPFIYTSIKYPRKDANGNVLLDNQGNTLMTHYPYVRDFLIKNILEEPKESRRRNAWAYFQTHLETANQWQIDRFKLWEKLVKYSYVDKYQRLDNMDDSIKRISTLSYKPEKNSAKREYYRELWLDRAADYGIIPQAVTWTTKDVSTFQVAPIAEPAWDPNVDPMEDYWVRPWKAYHKADGTEPESEKAWPWTTVATSYTIDEVPSYKEDEAFAIANELRKEYKDEFLLTASVPATLENNDYERRMQLAIEYVKAHKDELPPKELVAKAMALYEIPATKIVTKIDKSTGKEYKEIVTGESNATVTHRDVRLGLVDEEEPLELRDFQIEIDTIDEDEFDEYAFLGYAEEDNAVDEDEVEDDEDEDEEF